jgi:predicted extracellular nuclease
MPRTLLLALLIALSSLGGLFARSDESRRPANNLCPGARPIAQVRRLSAGSTATVRGVVTVPTDLFTAGQSFALQDATAGLYVYRRDGIGQKLALGDEVCATGRLTLYHGLLELAPGSAGQIVRLGNGKLPPPRPVASSEVGETTEGLLISITGPVSGLSDRRFRVGGAAVYLNAAAGLSTAGLQDGCPATVIGLSADYDAAQLWPRFASDIIPGDCAPAACQDYTIAQIQGRGLASPYDGRMGLSCLVGCVTGVGAKGFYVQSTVPDDDPLTSEGLFVYRWDAWTNPRGLRAGDLVELRDFDVQEFYGSTEIVGLENDTAASYRRIGTCELPAPIPIPPLADPQTDPASIYEQYEGMRVTMSFDGLVVGPTARYPSRFAAGEPEVAVVDRRSPFYGRRIFADDLPLGRGIIYLSGGLDQDLPDVGTGDRLTARELTGVLAYQFDRYVLLPDPGTPLPITVERTSQDAARSGDRPQQSVLAPIEPNEFAICSFNLENLFDAEDDGDGDVGDWAPADAAGFARQIEKRAKAIRDDLVGCTVIGVQEVEGKDAVWEVLAAAVGRDFGYDYYESADERDITVGILYDRRRAMLRRSEPAQECGPRDYAVDYTFARGPRAHPNPCQADSYPLFDRPPYLAELTIRDAAGMRALDVTVIVNHLKSKRGDEAENRPRRIAQAGFVAGLLTAPNTVALGDFNDPLGSATLEQFTGFVNLYEAHVAPADRYSYVYNGRSEALDHFIMTPGLDRYFKAGGPVHINADFPELRVPDATARRSSDHDPVFVRFSFRPTGVSAAVAGIVCGAIGGGY